MNEFALALLRTLGGVLDGVALREAYSWRALIDDCGGSSALISDDELVRLAPDTEVLAVALAGQPETITESWAVDMLRGLALAVGELARFADDVESQTGAHDLAWRALERQLTSTVAHSAPFAAGLLDMIGLLNRHVTLVDEPEDGERTYQDSFDDWSVRWSSLQRLVNDPGAWLTGTLNDLPNILPFAVSRLLQDVFAAPISFGEPRANLVQALTDAGVDPTQLHTEVAVWLPPLVDDGTRLLGFEALAGFFDRTDGEPGLSGALVGVQSNDGVHETFTRAVTDEIQLSLSVAADASILVGAGFTPDFALFAHAAGELGIEARFVWAPAPPTAESDVRMAVLPVLKRFEAFATLGGEASASGAHALGLEIGAAAEGEIRFDVGAALPIEVVEASIVVPWSVAVSWDSTRSGTGLEGGFALRSPPLPTLTLGPLSLSELTVGLEVSSAEAKLDMTFGIGLELGPLVVRAAGLGASGSLPLPAADESARQGLTFGFIPPTALEISADNPPMLRGGGAILFDEGRYAGFLSLQVYGLAVTALGLVEVELPPPGPSFSLFVLVSAQFPGIQLGYGFTLNGIGGLVGIHRTIHADALRADLSSGSVSSILDPGSEMDRAIELLARMGRYFPTRADRFVVGLAVQLRWVELVQIDIGVIIELPGPAKIVLLGRARIALEADDVALLRIQLEVLGIIDFEEKLLSIDAALRDSCLLEIFDITGGAAVRVSWGERPYALMSVGGFHPEFVPEPAVVPVPARVGLSTGDPGDWFYLRLQAYFAVTTSSLQLGAAVEVRINLEIIVVEGGLGFDALIVFDPFYFSIGFFAYLRVKVAGISLVGVAMRGTMSGPGPVTFSGEITVEILFITVSWSGAFSIGSEATPALETVDSVLDRVMAEIRPDTLRALASALPGAVVRAAEGDAGAVFDPAGGFEWTQGLVPLGVVVERIEGTPLARPLEVTVEAADFAPAYDWFAAASFAELSDAEALTRKTFERLEAGIGMTGESRLFDEGSAVDRPLRPELFVWPRSEPAAIVELQAVPLGVSLSARSRGARRPVGRIEPVLGLRDEGWTVAKGAPGPADSIVSETAAHQRARHDGGVAMSAGDAIDSGEL